VAPPHQVNHGVDHYADLAQSIAAQLATGSAGPEIQLNQIQLNRPGTEAGFYSALPDFSVLCVSGPDAVTFLHSQVTNDLAVLADQSAQLNGYCTPKGRLLATAITWRLADSIRLLVPSPEAASLASRLRKYVMRAKVSIALEEHLAVIGIAQSSGDVLAGIGMNSPPAMRTSVSGDRAAVGLEPVITEGRRWGRKLLLLRGSELSEIWQTLGQFLSPASTSDWRWLEVLSGQPRIVGGAVEQFVPQMINLERVDGVSFKKGCYPGQEVVARSQYLGKLKRRMFLATTQVALCLPGSDVFVTGQAEPVGQVVLGAPVPQHNGLFPHTTQVVLFEASREIVDANLEQAGLHLEGPDGPVLAGLALPYAL
jgi:folate-binding protein YgfZ